jgi:hypothetical protein
MKTCNLFPPMLSTLIFIYHIFNYNSTIGVNVARKFYSIFCHLLVLVPVYTAHNFTAMQDVIHVMATTYTANCRHLSSPANNEHVYLGITCYKDSEYMPLYPLPICTNMTS